MTSPGFIEKFPTVCIEWDDHYGDAGWVELTKDEAPVKCKTLGWLVREGEKGYDIMDTLTNDGGYGGHSYILKSCVTAIYVVRILKRKF